MDYDSLYNIISETLGVEKDKILPESDFFSDFNADRLELTDLILKIQQTYKLELKESDCQNIHKVSDLIRIIEENSDEI